MRTVSIEPSSPDWTKSAARKAANPTKNAGLRRSLLRSGDIAKDRSARVEREAIGTRLRASRRTSGGIRLPRLGRLGAWGGTRAGILVMSGFATPNPESGHITPECARNQHPSLLIKQILANHGVGLPDALGGSLNFPSQFAIKIGTLRFLMQGILSRAYKE